MLMLEINLAGKISFLCSLIQFEYKLIYLDKLFHKVCFELSYSVVEEYLIHEALSLKISMTALEGKDFTCKHCRLFCIKSGFEVEPSQRLPCLRPCHMSQTG